MRPLKRSMIAVIISGVLFVLFLDNMYYANVMNFSLLAGMTMGALIAVISTNLTKGTLRSAFLGGVLLLLCISITIPNLTYDQASELVQNNYPGQILNAGFSKKVPIKDGEFTLIMPRSFYLFSLEHDEGTQQYIVNPNTGKIALLH
ncbi:hypothetical protein E2R51_12865 [Jeotgalibacillus sp. S-D1]|uniref:PepSY domain-containing protein n=1 Tax=Jeotgalibacillus sp. S-D1 TaxID=2552189 RepID=UPI00105A630C|nr:PepSY domain-containing protein [Jeotgalibacillus sp. S-D1]TDL31261.1 hypothetical protein E2R51_12865 [Jeotgalibacillus sp. S-D1]